MMKVLLTVMLAVGLLFLGENGVVDNFSYAGQDKKVEEKDTSVKSLLDRIWTKIRTLSPKKKRRASGAAVAGVKGAEKGSEELSPYWKGDSSANLQKEIERYSVAEGLLEEEKFSEAIVAFDSFRGEFTVSRFIPNAIFSKGLCLIKMEQTTDAVGVLQGFVKDYPNHELTADAKELLSVLK